MAKIVRRSQHGAEEIELGSFQLTIGRRPGVAAPPVSRPPATPVPAVAGPLEPPPIPVTAGPFDLPLLNALPDAGTETRQAADVAPSGLLDQLVGSIRSHREREQLERDGIQARLQSEWGHAVASAEQLKLKVEGDPRVHYFAISRRNNDIIIRAQRAADLPVTFTQLSLEHPEDQGHALTGIWLRRTGQADRCYATAREVMSELVRELAFLIA